MNISVWIAIYLPLFVSLFIIIPVKREVEKVKLIKTKRRRGLKTMTNELIKNYIGKKCKLSAGSFGTNVVGKIVDVKENWIVVETRKGQQLVNADFIQNIRLK